MCIRDSSLGDPELRREIAAFYLREYGVTVDPDCIVVTSVSSASILLALMLLYNPDSEVILSNPGYACYRNFVLATQAKPVLVPLSKEYLQYDIEAIRKCVNPHTAAIFINSPMNPTGMLLDEKFLKDVAALGVPVISDEIYHGLVYEGCLLYTSGKGHTFGIVEDVSELKTNGIVNMLLYHDANSDEEYYNRRAYISVPLAQYIDEEHPGRTMNIKFKYCTYDKDGSAVVSEKYCDPGFDYTPGQN